MLAQNTLDEIEIKILENNLEIDLTQGSDIPNAVRQLISLLEKKITISLRVRSIALLQGLQKKMSVSELKKLSINPINAQLLRRAVKIGEIDVVAWILRAVGDNIALINARNQDGVTALHLAASCGHENILSLLINSGADVTLQTRRTETALILAAQRGYLGCVRRLLKKIDDKAAVLDALKEAIEYDQVIIFETLLGVSALDADELFELLCLASQGSPAVIEVLLMHGADFTRENNEKETALSIAAKTGCLESVQALLKKTHSQEAMVAAMMKAIKYSHESVLEELLALRSFKINDLIAGGKCTLLHYAADNAKPDMVRLLLNHGADTDVYSVCGCTALDFSDTPEVFKILLPIVKKNQILVDSLCIAALYGNTEFIIFFLKLYPTLVNEHNRFGVTPLHYAAQSDDVDTVILLLAKGADVTVLDRDGYTVLHYTVENETLEVAQVLVEAEPQGVNLRIPEVLTHATPIQFARAWKNQPLAEYLERVCPGQESNLRPVP